MKQTEKSRSKLLLLQRESFSKDMLEHQDKLLHFNTTRKKLIRAFQEDLGSLLHDSTGDEKNQHSQGSDETSCLSTPPRTSPYSSPSQLSYYNSKRRTSPYTSPSQVAHYPSKQRTSPYNSPGDHSWSAWEPDSLPNYSLNYSPSRPT
jgi:hypothetical protein